jgi:hypothetical protein
VLDLIAERMKTPGCRHPGVFSSCGEAKGLAAEADHRAIAFIGESDPDRTVMAQAFDHDLAVIGADHFGAADAHVTGLVDGEVGAADIAVTAKPVPAATKIMIAAAAAVLIADDDGGAGAADGKFEADAAGSGGGSGSGHAGSGNNEGGERGANEAVHDGVS